jgi:hypothetical protein
MNAMAIDADSNRFHRGLIAKILLLLVQLQSNAVKILKITFQNRCRQTVLIHQRFVGMAVAAHLRYFLPEVKRAGIHHAVSRMAVRAYRDVLIVFVEQGAAVNTRCVYLINFTVTLFASLGAQGPILSHTGNRMRSVAIDTDRGVQVPLAQQCIVDTLQCFRIFVKMAPSAAFGGSDGIISLGLEIPFGMFFRRKSEMAVRAVQPAVSRQGKGLRVYFKRLIFSIPE